jgi:hypothetical protein
MDAMYPFVGTEVTLTIVSVVVWIGLAPLAGQG